MQLDALTNKLSAYSIQLQSVRGHLLLDEKILRQLLLLEELVPDKFGSILSNILDNFPTFWSKLMSERDPYVFMMNPGWLLVNLGGPSQFEI